MAKIKVFFCGLRIATIGFLLVGLPVVSFIGVITFLLGLYVTALAFSSKQNFKPQNENNKTKTSKNDEVFEDYDRNEVYKCEECSGTGEVWVCSYCGSDPQIEAEDRDGFNLFCKNCEEAGVKYEIVEDTCPNCNGNKYIF